MMGHIWISSNKGVFGSPKKVRGKIVRGKIVKGKKV
jgi:hypothetical protein